MNILQLKPCTPEDVTAAVPLIYASGPDAFEFVFKNDEKSAKDFLAFAFLRKGRNSSFTDPTFPEKTDLSDFCLLIHKYRPYRSF